MSVMENTKRRVEKDTTVAREVAVHIIYFVLGVLISHGAMLGEMSPFGASFIASVPFVYMPASLLSVALGYLLLSPINSFRYIAIIISIAAIRWVLNEIKRISNSRFFSSVVAFIPVFATGLALTFTSQSTVSEISSCFIEAILSAGGAYFMSRTVKLSYSFRGITSFSWQELACLVMSGCILLLSFSSFAIGNISVGRILAVLIILFAAKYTSVSGGSIAGIATGIVFSLADSDLLFLSAAYSLSGLIGGLFSSLSKIAVCISVLICNTIMAFSAYDNAVVFNTIIESVAASLIFMLIPKNIGNYVSSVFSDDSKFEDENAIKRNVITRLSHCSKAIENVSACVNQVSDRLTRIYNPNIIWVYEKASERTCSKCGLRVFCWDKQKELTTDDFYRLSNILKEKGFVKDKDIEDNFLKHCCKTGELAYSINESYKDYLSYEAAKRRITQIRSVVAGQFAGLSDILQDLAEEFEDYNSFDTNAASRVSEALKSLGLVVVDCSCKKTLAGGAVVEIELVIGKKTAISKSDITKEVSKACGRYFESPTISFVEDRARITLCEHPIYDLQIGSSQHTYKNGDLCGDCINYFNNGAGSTVAIISDGMGTGGRAAVDSNMAVSIMSKLCKAGLSYDCALSVVNSSLMIKSEDESMATLDVLDFNLFTGKAELMKAGACTTYIKKNSKIIKKDMPSLPIGILNEAKFSKEAITLSEDDFIVMVSDGAIVDNDTWIEKAILSFREGSAQDLSSYIVEEAAKRRNDGHDDDITAIAFKVIENV